MKQGYVFDDFGRKILGYCVFGTILSALIYRFCSNALFHQLEAPILKFAWVDLGYWIAHLFRLPELFTGSFTLAVIFDLCLFSSALLSLIFIKKRAFPIVFGILFTIYFFTYNSFSAHHTHCMAGILLVSVPFWFKNPKTFSLLWEGLRYYTLFIYFSAFLWKLCRNALLHPDQGQAIFLNETAHYIVQAPNSLWGNLYSYFITHPPLAFALVTIGIFAQATFIIGFFTRKYDWLWFILPIFFHTISYFFLGVFFFELLVLNFGFLPWGKILDYLQKGNSSASLE